MAAGEVLFHDLVGIAKSTEAAQLLAVVCLSIVILQIVERVYRDLAAGDVLISLCATAATALAVVLVLPEAFTSMWPAYIYVTNGLLFFVGGAALIAGRFKWLWVFVLGSALLVKQPRKDWGDVARALLPHWKFAWWRSALSWP